jgi:hypothetical protein
VQAAFEAAARDWATVRRLAEAQRLVWLRTTAANIAVSGFRREAAWRDRLPRIEARYRTAEVDLPAQAFTSIVLERCWKIMWANNTGSATIGYIGRGIATPQFGVFSHGTFRPLPIPMLKPGNTWWQGFLMNRVAW